CSHAGGPEPRNSRNTRKITGSIPRFSCISWLIPAAPAEDRPRRADSIPMKIRVALAAALVVASTLVVDADGPGPREALGLLKAGNERFSRNVSSPVSLSVNRRQELMKGQHPMAM